VYSRVLQLSTALAAQIMLSACSTYSTAAPDISPNEMRVLVAQYYWQPDRKPFTYTSEQLDRLLRRSADPTLDGEYAEAQTASVVWALVFVGDERFSQAVAREPDEVKRAVARDVENLWRRHGLHYPKTQRVLQPYT
jgi:hypothetical protein